MEEEITDFNVNLAEVHKHKDLFAVTRLLATSLQMNPYLHPGLYIKEMADSDLEQLLECVDPDEDRFQNIVLIAMMLSAAEGLAMTQEQVHRSINALIVMLSSESLYRKGLIDIFHNKFSFGSDADNDVVLKKKDGVDYDAIIRRLDNGEGV